MSNIGYTKGYGCPIDDWQGDPEVKQYAKDHEIEWGVGWQSRYDQAENYRFFGATYGQSFDRGFNTISPDNVRPPELVREVDEAYAALPDEIREKLQPPRDFVLIWLD